MTHGHAREAESVVAGIEARVGAEGRALPPPSGAKLRLRSRRHTPIGEVLRVLFISYRRRALVGLSLMAAQAFFYNAIFFTYALVLTDFYGVAASNVGWYLLPFAAGNFCGPLLLGRLFDTLGRRRMIAATYALSGILLVGAGQLFAAGVLDVVMQTIAWSVIFFFASAAASAAYLTVSENFPLEMRALAIAVFYAIGTGLGGIASPALFGALIATHDRASVNDGYLVGAGLMVIAAVVAAIWAYPAERKALEDVARPLTAVD
jgi:MFS family permease